MTFNHVLVNQILDAIFPLPSKFGIEIPVDEEVYPKNYNIIKSEIFHVDPYACVYFGASKIVIASPKIGNAVVKIPFNGTYYQEEENDEEFEWIPFEWAPGSDPADYCLAEYEKYQRLKDYGLGCFVAKTLFYKKRDGFRIFIQEYVMPENESCDSHNASDQSTTTAKKWRREGKIRSDLENEWIANCLDIYGESKVKRFLYYCDNIDPDILEDIHKANYGYRENGTPCILDFSNYMD